MENILKKLISNIANTLLKVLLEDFNYNYKDRIITESILLNNKILNEEFHEIYGTEKIINDIISKVNNITLNTYIYSSWEFEFNKQKKPPYHFIQNTLDNKHINHPIYIKIVNIEDDDIYGKTQMRQIDNITNYNNDPIYITLNIYNKDFLKYTLKHELTHIVNMFSTYKHNNIMNLKNTTGYDNNDLQLNPYIYKKIQRMLYLTMQTELDAHINGLIEYFKTLTDKDKNDLLISCNETISFKKIFFFLTENETISKLTLFSEFREYLLELENLMNIGDYNLLFYIGYYLQKHHIIWLSLHINKLFILNYKKEKFKNIFNKDYDSIANKIYQIYSSLLFKYLKKLFDITYKYLLK